MSIDYPRKYVIYDGQFTFRKQFRVRPDTFVCHWLPVQWCIKGVVLIEFKFTFVRRMDIEASKIPYVP